MFTHSKKLLMSEKISLLDRGQRVGILVHVFTLCCGQDCSCYLIYGCIS